MSNKLIAKAKSGALLFANLDWRVLGTSAHTDAALREAAESRGSRYAVRIKSHLTEIVEVKGKNKELYRTSAGLWGAGMDEAKMPKNSHSLAACFADLVTNDGFSDAILALDILDHEQKYERTLVVVVANGMPSLDKLMDSKAAAHDLTRQYLKENPSYTFYASDAVMYPNAYRSGSKLLSTISEFASRKTQLSAIPVDVMKAIIVAAILALILAGYYYYQKEEKRKAELAAEAARIAADPIPKYLTALSQAKSKVGISPESLVQSYNYAKKVATGMAGWKATKVSCQIDQGCTVELKRVDGTFQKLVASAGELSLHIKPESVNLNEAILRWEQKMDVVRLENELVNSDSFIKGSSGSLLQNWQTAKLSVSLVPPVLWPNAPGVPPNFRHAAAVKQGGIEITGVRLPQMIEVMTYKPENVYWLEWAIDVTDSNADPMTAASGKLKGKFYVKQN